MADSLRKVLYETVKDLYKAGAMRERTMREFEARRLPKVKAYSPKQIQSLRRRCHASQAVFAAYLNTTPSTIQKWEYGTKRPNGPSLKLLNLVDTKGLKALA